MGLYRTKPQIKEAFKWIGEETQNSPQWILDAMKNKTVWVDESIYDNQLKMFIKTLEGTMQADLGDYIIKGLKGELYPCKPDIFEKSYEEVHDGNETINNGSTL